MTYLPAFRSDFISHYIISPPLEFEPAATATHHTLEIEDTGIGISLEDQRRLFQPFVQLHSVEVYEGVGLGLAAVRRVVELMGGRVGVTYPRWPTQTN